MIDIENYILTEIAEAVHLQYPDALVLGDYIEEFASYPTLTVTEIDNRTLRRMQDEAPVEHYARVTYDVNVYSNDQIGKKEECKDILNIVDTVMFGLKFTRGPLRRLPAIDHSRAVYRMYGRYTAVVDEGVVEDRDGVPVTVHHMYRG